MTAALVTGQAKGCYAWGNGWGARGINEATCRKHVPFKLRLRGGCVLAPSLEGAPSLSHIFTFRYVATVALHSLAQYLAHQQL